MPNISLVFSCLFIVLVLSMKAGDNLKSRHWAAPLPLFSPRIRHSKAIHTGPFLLKGVAVRWTTSSWNYHKHPGHHETSSCCVYVCILFNYPLIVLFCFPSRFLASQKQELGLICLNTLRLKYLPHGTFPPNYCWINTLLINHPPWLARMYTHMNTHIKYRWLIGLSPFAKTCTWRVFVSCGDLFGLTKTHTVWAALTPVESWASENSWEKKGFAK